MSEDDVWRKWAWGGDDLGSRRVDRRQVLSAVGAAGAAAVAGCSDQTGEGTTTDDTTTDTMSTDTQTTDDGTDDDQPDMNARFGMTAPKGSSEKAIEADHTVDLEFEFVDGREIPEFYFEPTGLKIEPGDTVKFNMATPHHNVNAYHPAFGYEQRVPDGVPAFSSPILAGGDAWYYTFDTEGVHDIVCAPHEIYGMAGRIVVGSATGPGANPVGEAPGDKHARPPEQTAGLVLSDDAMAADNIVSEESVSWSDVADENKRLLMEPVEASGE